MQTSPHNEGYGETTGTYYFIPASDRTLAYELLEQVVDMTKEYVNAHSSEDYSLHFLQDFNIHSSLMWSQLNFFGKNESGHSKTYVLFTDKDEAGFYFLSIVTDGDFWVPRDWPRLKSWVNGVRKEW